MRTTYYILLSISRKCRDEYKNYTNGLLIINWGQATSHSNINSLRWAI